MATKKKKKIPINEKTVRLFGAFFLAVLIWLFVNGNGNNIVAQDINGIPVTLANVETLQAKNLVLADTRTYYVNLRVQGTDRSLSEIKTTEITAEADLKDIEKKGTYNLSVAVKGLSNSVILNAVTPSTVEIIVDSTIESEREVSVITDGKAGDDNVVISATSDKKVRLAGPEEKIAQVDKVAAFVNVNGITTDTTKYLTVVPYNKDGDIVTGVECEPEAVTASIVVGKTKTVPVIVPATTGTVQSGYKVTGVTVEPTQKMVGAKQNVLDTISSIQVNPVDINGASKSVTKEITLGLPDGASFLDNSNKATVTVTIEPLIEKSFTVSSIETRNLAAGLNAAKIKDSTVVVKLTGTASELNKMSGEDIKAFVDLTGLAKGDQETAIQISVPNDQLKSVTPSKTTVTIE